MTNPFTERARITIPERFTGRWGELSQLFERLEAGRPVLVTGRPAVGKSSLLTHVMQSAATTLDLPELQAYFLDLAKLPDAAECYRLVSEALGQRGNSAAALEVALAGSRAPVLLCLDNAHQAIAAGWGQPLLETLARIARGADLLLVAALNGPPPLLSERFATITLGAFAPTEVGLLAESYLEDSGVSFTPAEVRALADLSAAHPAYVQRAAFHLFRSKLQPGYNWRSAYLDEAREQPVPGAPLPPEVFEGASGERVDESAYGDDTVGTPVGPHLLPIPEVSARPLLLVPLLLGLLVLITGNNPLLALGVAGLGLLAVALVVHFATRR